MRRTLPLVAVLTSLGCAPLLRAPSETRTSDPAAPADGKPSERGARAGNLDVEMMKKMAAMQSAQGAASATCGVFARREVPWAEEVLVGRIMATSLTSRTPLVADAALTTRVATVGKLLARRSARPDLAWTFGVVQNDLPQASALPGGYVFVTTGLLSRMTNEAELAGVLAREVAHVAARDPVNVYRDVTARQCEAATMMGAMAQAGLSPGPEQAQLVKFAREFTTPFDLERRPTDFQVFLLDAVMQVGSLGRDENAADEVGAELTALTGYDLAAFEALLTRLDAEPLQKNEKGEAVRTGYLAFKPATAERVAKLKALREGALAAFAHGSAKPDLTPLVAPLKKP